MTPSKYSDNCVYLNTLLLHIYIYIYYRLAVEFANSISIVVDDDDDDGGDEDLDSDDKSQLHNGQRECRWIHGWIHDDSNESWNSCPHGNLTKTSSCSKSQRHIEQHGKSLSLSSLSSLWCC